MLRQLRTSKTDRPLCAAANVEPPRKSPGKTIWKIEITISHISIN